MKKYLIISLSLLATHSYGIITQKSMSYTVEENICGTLFKQHTAIAAGQRLAQYYVDGRATDRDTFENALLDAEKEELRQKRQREHDHQLKVFELQYQGEIRLSQAELKKATEQLVDLLKTALNDNLEQFRCYSPQTISSHEELISLAETVLPHAKKLYRAAPSSITIEELSGTLNSINNYIAHLRSFVTDSVQQGIRNAHDTKVLKELLALAGTL